MVRTPADVVFVGIGGHAAAIDAATGSEIWRRKLKIGSYVTVHLAGDRLFAGAGGELFCLDAASGELLWHNKLRGLGLGLVAFDSSTQVAVGAASQAQQAANGAL